MSTQDTPWDPDPAWLRKRRRLSLSTKIDMHVAASHEDAMLWCELTQRKVKSGAFNPMTVSIELGGVIFSAVYPRWMPNTEQGSAWFWLRLFEGACAHLDVDPATVPLDQFVTHNLSTGETFRSRSA